MDLEIIIKGGVELQQFYPKKYEAFQEKIEQMIMDTFPGVMGYSIGSEPTAYHQAQQQRREDKEEEALKQALIDVFKEPEVQAMLQQQA